MAIGKDSAAVLLEAKGRLCYNYQVTDKIFGKDGGKVMAEQLGIKLLGSVPIYMSINEGGDTGMPVAFTEGPEAEAFSEIVNQI